MKGQGFLCLHRGTGDAHCHHYDASAGGIFDLPYRREYTFERCILVIGSELLIEVIAFTIAIEEDSIMLSRELPLNGRIACFIAPCNLVEEFLRTEYCIHDHPEIMPCCWIAMQIDTSRGRQQVAAQGQAIPHHLAVRSKSSAPRIPVRQFLNHTGTLLQRDIANFHLVRKIRSRREGRINVDQVDLPGELSEQRAEDVLVIAPDQAVTPAFRPFIRERPPPPLCSVST